MPSAKLPNARGVRPTSLRRGGLAEPPGSQHRNPLAGFLVELKEGGNECVGTSEGAPRATRKGENSTRKTPYYCVYRRFSKHILREGGRDKSTTERSAVDMPPLFFPWAFTLPRWLALRHTPPRNTAKHSTAKCTMLQKAVFL